MKKIKNLLLPTLILALFSAQLHANNIQISNTTLTGRNTSAGVNNAANYSMIQFDLSWSNSWRSGTTNNWDAAWVFVKFRLGAVDYLSTAGATNSGTTITVNTTNGLRVGMPVFVNSGTGAFASGTVITAINSATTFTVSAALTTSLSSSAVVRAERIWEHCWLNNTGHNKGSIGSSGSLQVGLQDEGSAFNASTNPALGTYFYRSANGTGTFTTTGAQLQWNYGAQGIKDNDIVDIQVFATEMVNVPTAAHNIDTAQYLSNTVLLLDGDGTNGAQNNTFIDGSTNNFTITRFGNTTQGPVTPFCGTGGSGYFDGSGDYLSVPDNAAFDIGSGSFTMESWIYLTSFGNTSAMIACQDGSSGSNRSWTFQLWGTSTIGLTLFTGGSPVSSSGNFNFALNTWYHVAAVRNGTSLRLYVNGSDVGGGTNATTANNSASNITIGAEDPTWQGSYPYWFPGYISNLRILKGTAAYTANFTPPTGALSAVPNTSLLLRFENSPLDDTRRKSNIETVGNAQVSTAQSIYGGSSILLGGAGNRLFIPSPLVGPSEQTFTVECWIYMNGNGASAFGSALIGLDANHNASLTWMNFGPNSNRQLSLRWVSSVFNTVTGNTVMNLNQWYHIALSVNNNNISMFVDGVAQTISPLVSLTTRGGTSNSSQIGEMQGSHVNAYMDDLRIIRGAALYTSNFTPPASAHTITNGGAYPITSENALTLGGTAAANLKYRFPNVSIADDFTNSTTQTLGASFPKGYNGFYAMKYELSQQQWLDFFNSLTTIQKTARDITGASGKNTDAISFRNNISWSSGDATLNSSTHGNVACNWLNWPDAAAYADWSGLRPMTELEFEKAARGTSSPAVGEPASGSSCGGDPNLTAATGISNSGAANETASNTSASAVYNNQASVQGPLRCGALATSSSTRTTAGAGFYGVMDLSGNATEQVVSIGNSTGRSFTGSHGNGALNTVGNADISTWPGYVTNAVTGATGSGKRGGSWEDIADRLLISDRFHANSTVTTRDRNTGFRAARNLPSTPAQ